MAISLVVATAIRGADVAVSTDVVKAAIRSGHGDGCVGVLCSCADHHRVLQTIIDS